MKMSSFNPKIRHETDESGRTKSKYIQKFENLDELPDYTRNQQVRLNDLKRIIKKMMNTHSHSNTASSSASPAPDHPIITSQHTIPAVIPNLATPSSSSVYVPGQNSFLMKPNIPVDQIRHDERKPTLPKSSSNLFVQSSDESEAESPDEHNESTKVLKKPPIYVSLDSDDEMEVAPATKQEFSQVEITSPLKRTKFQNIEGYPDQKIDSPNASFYGSPPRSNINNSPKAKYSFGSQNSQINIPGTQKKIMIMKPSQTRPLPRDEEDLKREKVTKSYTESKVYQTDDGTTDDTDEEDGDGEDDDELMDDEDGELKEDSSDESYTGDEINSPEDAADSLRESVNYGKLFEEESDENDLSWDMLDHSSPNKKNKKVLARRRLRGKKSRGQDSSEDTDASFHSESLASDESSDSEYSDSKGRARYRNKSQSQKQYKYIYTEVSEDDFVVDDEDDIVYSSDNADDKVFEADERNARRASKRKRRRSDHTKDKSKKKKSKTTTDQSETSDISIDKDESNDKLDVEPTNGSKPTNRAGVKIITNRPQRVVGQSEENHDADISTVPKLNILSSGKKFQDRSEAKQVEEIDLSDLDHDGDSDSSKSDIIKRDPSFERAGQSLSEDLEQQSQTHNRRPKYIISDSESDDESEAVHAINPTASTESRAKEATGLAIENDHNNLSPFVKLKLEHNSKTIPDAGMQRDRDNITLDAQDKEPSPNLENDDQVDEDFSDINDLFNEAGDSADANGTNGIGVSSTYKDHQKPIQHLNSNIFITRSRPKKTRPTSTVLHDNNKDTGALKSTNGVEASNSTDTGKVQTMLEKSTLNETSMTSDSKPNKSSSSVSDNISEMNSGTSSRQQKSSSTAVGDLARSSASIPKTSIFSKKKSKQAKPQSIPQLGSATKERSKKSKKSKAIKNKKSVSFANTEESLPISHSSANHGQPSPLISSGSESSNSSNGKLHSILKNANKPFSLTNAGSRNPIPFKGSVAISANTDHNSSSGWGNASHVHKRQSEVPNIIENMNPDGTGQVGLLRSNSQKNKSLNQMGQDEIQGASKDIHRTGPEGSVDSKDNLSKMKAKVVSLSPSPSLPASSLNFTASSQKSTGSKFNEWPSKQPQSQNQQSQMQTSISRELHQQQNKNGFPKHRIKNSDTTSRSATDEAAVTERASTTKNQLTKANANNRPQAPATLAAKTMIRPGGEKSVTEKSIIDSRISSNSGPTSTSRAANQRSSTTYAEVESDSDADSGIESDGIELLDEDTFFKSLQK